MIMILLKSLGKRTSIGSYYDEKSLTKCYWDGVFWLFLLTKKARKLRPRWSENSVPEWHPFGTSSISQLLYGSFSFPFSGQFLLLQIYLFQLSHRYLSLSHHLLQLRPAVQHVLLLILKIQVHS